MSDYQTRVLERRRQFALRWLDRLKLTDQRLQTTESDLSQTARDFHQICGAAGIYELDDLCTKAIACEELCQKLAAGNSTASKEQVDWLRENVASITKLLESLAGA